MWLKYFLVVNLEFILQLSSWRCWTFVIKSCYLSAVYKGDWEQDWGAGACKRSVVVSSTKGAFSQDLLPVKINFLLKQMGQTDVNKLFKLFLNSQGVPFKRSTRLPDWVFNYTEFRKSLKTWSLWTLEKWTLLTGHLGSHSHGARMVSLMDLVTIVLRSTLFCLFLPPIRFLSSWETGYRAFLSPCPHSPRRCHCMWYLRCGNLVRVGPGVGRS